MPRMSDTTIARVRTAIASGEMTRAALARAAGVAPSAVRYYERTGVLPEPARTAKGYRVYGPDDVERLRFVRDAQATGLTLIEIKSILELKGQGERSCEHTRSLIHRQIDDIDAQIHRLEHARRELRDPGLARTQQISQHLGIVFAFFWCRAAHSDRRS